MRMIGDRTNERPARLIGIAHDQQSVVGQLFDNIELRQGRV